MNPRASADDRLANVDTSLRKLNLGCGWDHRPGYINVDFVPHHKPDLLADVRDLSMFPADHFDEILAQDVLEHLERTEIDSALEEWARLLRPGGELFVRVPNIIGVAELLKEKLSFEEQSTLVQNLFGTQAYTGDYHHVGFTEITLRTQLHAAGLEVVSLEAKDRWLFDCVSVKRDKPFELDLGALSFMGSAESREPSESLGSVDRVASAVSRRLPSAVREPLQIVWRPVRSSLTRIGVRT